MEPQHIKVAHVDSERGFSGGEVQVFLLLEGLRRLGCRQVLVVPPGSKSEQLAKERGFDVAPVKIGRVFDVRGYLGLRRALRGCSIAQLHTGRAAWLGGLAARSLGIQAVITRRMDRKVRRGPRTHIAYNVCAAKTVAISPAVRQCLIDGGVAADRIELIYEAVDPARIVANRSRAAVRDELRAGADQFVVMTAARLTERKGIDVLIEAVAALADPKIVLVVAGDGPESAPLRELAAARGIADNCRFLGSRSDVGDLLAACDVFAVPSRAEGLGNAALEALGAGRPVVASRVGGLAAMIVDEESGLLVPPDAPPLLAAAIARLRDDDGLRARFAAAGPVRLDQGFRPEQMVEQHLALYARLLGG